eukprot:COSAG04_NODE_42_length_32379_cov_41.656691_26_plen_298_part_00
MCLAGGLGEAEAGGDAVRRALERVPVKPPANVLCPLAAQYGRTEAEQARLMTDAVWDATDGRVVSAWSLENLPQGDGHETPAGEQQEQVSVTRHLATLYESIYEARAECNHREGVMQLRLAAAVDTLNAAECVAVTYPQTAGIRFRYVDLSVSEDEQQAVWERKISQQKAIALEAEGRLQPKVADATRRFADELKKASQRCPADGASRARLTELEAAVRKGGTWHDTAGLLTEAISIMEKEATALGANETNGSLLKEAHESMATDMQSAAADACALDRVRDEFESTKKQTVENMVLR